VGEDQVPLRRARDRFEHPRRQATQAVGVSTLTASVRAAKGGGVGLGGLVGRRSAEGVEHAGGHQYGLHAPSLGHGKPLRHECAKAQQILHEGHPPKQGLDPVGRVDRHIAGDGVGVGRAAAAPVCVEAVVGNRVEGDLGDRVVAKAGRLARHGRHSTPIVTGGPRRAAAWQGHIQLGGSDVEGRHPHVTEKVVCDGHLGAHVAEHDRVFRAVTRCRAAGGFPPTRRHVPVSLRIDGEAVVLGSGDGGVEAELKGRLKLQAKIDRCRRHQQRGGQGGDRRQEGRDFLPSDEGGARDRKRGGDQRQHRGAGRGGETAGESW